MTVTFDSGKYKDLLLKYPPKIIRTEKENEQALAIVEVLMHRQRTPEEDELYELLIWLIERFESEFYEAGEASSPYSLLLFLMEQRGINWQDLREVLGMIVHFNGLFVLAVKFISRRAVEPKLQALSSLS